MNTKSFFHFSIYVILFFAYSCEEKNELINFNTEEFNTLKIDSTFQSTINDSSQKKNVLLEDFTAVRCVNCPRAQNEAKKLQALYPGRVIVSSVHVTDLATPYPQSKNNFKTTEGENLLSYLGGATGLPVGTIDRKVYGANTTPFVYDFQWKALVSSQLSLTTPVNIDIKQLETNEDRIARWEIKVTYTDDVNSANFISAMINESNFTDLQLTPSGIDSNYIHNHVLRSIMQPGNGLKLGDNFKKGNSYIIKIATKLPQEWNVGNCRIILFVHQRESNFDVIQVQEAHIE